MSKVYLIPPLLTDCKELLSFELENRAFFESHINSRPRDFYSVEGVRTAVERALQEASSDKSFQYLVRDAGGRLIGRVNLSRVRRAHFHSAELGYRIAQSACGNGYASAAVQAILNIAFQELGLVRLEATARPENFGSSRVLQKNGFLQFGRSTKSFELAGTWYDLIHYERRADA